DDQGEQLRGRREHRFAPEYPRGADRHLFAGLSCRLRPPAGLPTSAYLVGADDLEVLVDEDVMRPVDADVVHLVLSVVQFDNTVDDATGVRGQRSLRRLVGLRTADN